MTGILIIGVANNAMQLASFPDFCQNVVRGVILYEVVGFGYGFKIIRSTDDFYPLIV